jgi:hypothetical protein
MYLLRMQLRKVPHVACYVVVVSVDVGELDGGDKLEEAFHRTGHNNLVEKKLDAHVHLRVHTIRSIAIVTVETFAVAAIGASLAVTCVTCSGESFGCAIDTVSAAAETKATATATANSTTATTTAAATATTLDKMSHDVHQLNG